MNILEGDLSLKVKTREIAEAIYTINRHAKTAPEPQQLYKLKKYAIEKLLQENRAVKAGLHFSDHPKFSNQHSTLLIRIEDFYFHIPPTKDDFKNLKHLGSLDQSYRNPQAKMSLSKAKRLVANYLGWTLEDQNNKKPEHTSNYYTPSVLGKFSWTPLPNKSKAVRNRPKKD